MDKKNYALVNCTVIDGHLNSHPLENAVILVKNLVVIGSRSQKSKK